VRRSEILAFLSARSIPFRRDATNGDLRLERNRVRRDLAALDAPARRALEAGLAASRERARSLESALAASILPTFRASPCGGRMEADASRLQSADEELRRLAIDRLTAPFARTGRAPMTGREREALVARLGSGADFRFEAGRRIRFERRGDRLIVGPRAAGAPPSRRAV
jgi:tRNA(Ile)-lysidine synthase